MQVDKMLDFLIQGYTFAEVGNDLYNLILLRQTNIGELFHTLICIYAKTRNLENI